MLERIVKTGNFVDEKFLIESKRWKKIFLNEYRKNKFDDLYFLMNVFY